MVDRTMIFEHSMEVQSHSSAINVLPNKVTFQPNKTKAVSVIYVVYHYISPAPITVPFEIPRLQQNHSKCPLKPKKCADTTHTSECQSSSQLTVRTFFTKIASNYISTKTEASANEWSIGEFGSDKQKSRSKIIRISSAVYLYVHVSSGLPLRLLFKNINIPVDL